MLSKLRPKNINVFFLLFETQTRERMWEKTCIQSKLQITMHTYAQYVRLCARIHTKRIQQSNVIRVPLEVHWKSIGTLMTFDCCTRLVCMWAHSPTYCANVNMVICRFDSMRVLSHIRSLFFTLTQMCRFWHLVVCFHCDESGLRLFFGEIGVKNNKKNHWLLSI